MVGFLKLTHGCRAAPDPMAQGPGARQITKSRTLCGRLVLPARTGISCSAKKSRNEPDQTGAREATGGKQGGADGPLCQIHGQLR